jgi:hypothetical protein
MGRPPRSSWRSNVPGCGNKGTALGQGSGPGVGAAFMLDGWTGIQRGVAVAAGKEGIALGPSSSPGSRRGTSMGGQGTVGGSVGAAPRVRLPDPPPRASC